MLSETIDGKGPGIRMSFKRKSGLLRKQTGRTLVLQVKRDDDDQRSVENGWCTGGIRLGLPAKVDEDVTSDPSVG